MTIFNLGLVVLLLAVTVLMLRILWFLNIKEFITEVTAGVKLTMSTAMLKEIGSTAKSAWQRVTQGKIRQGVDLILPVLGLPVIICLYFLSTVVFLFWILTPFLILLMLIA